MESKARELVLGPNGAEEKPAPTDEKVLVLARDIVQEARGAAFYPHAYAKEGFEAFYNSFHVIARKLRTGIFASDLEAVQKLKYKYGGLTKLVDEPSSTVWHIWGENMASEDLDSIDGWELGYDESYFKPFLNPYLVADQTKVKGNVLVIAGGGNTHRANQVEGYPVAEFFNAKGYNAFVLQRRVLPYADVDCVLDLTRSIRYIRYNAEKLSIGATDKFVTCGFSAGGMNICRALSIQYGNVTPDAIYPHYVCDKVDAVNADYDAALLIYGSVPDIDFSANENMPAMFLAAGQEDSGFWTRTANMALKMLDSGINVEVFLTPKTPHGFGLGRGTVGYTDIFTAASAWPDLAITFLDIELGYIPGVIPQKP